MTIERGSARDIRARDDFLAGRHCGGATERGHVTANQQQLRRGREGGESRRKSSDIQFAAPPVTKSELREIKAHFSSSKKPRHPHQVVLVCF